MKNLVKTEIIENIYSQINGLETAESKQKLEAICQIISNQIKEDDSFISEERKAKLEEIIQYAKSKINENKDLNLTFICIHNSRRSHFSEVWFHIASLFHNLKVNTSSGGTSETACNYRVISSFNRFGFDVTSTLSTKNENGVEIISSDTNPLYTFDFKGQSKFLFSKVFNCDYNPNSNFVAVMVCSEAETNCPYVFAADSRISMPFSDPSEFDGTELESEGYDKKSIEIALEMFYLVSKIKE